MTYGPVTPVADRAPKDITLPEQIQAVGNEIDHLPTYAFLRCTKLLAVLATLVEVSEKRRKRQIRRAIKKAQPKIKESAA